LIQIKSPGHLHTHDTVRLSPARPRLPPQSQPMQKFALKMLLTSLTVGRSSSRRVRGVQVVTAVLTLFLLVTVGLYIWAHGGH
jgi:hypothetical protein